MSAVPLSCPTGALALVGPFRASWGVDLVRVHGPEARDEAGDQATVPGVRLPEAGLQLPLL